MSLEKHLDSFIIEMRNTKNLSNKSIKAYYSDILNFIKFKYSYTPIYIIPQIYL